MFLITRVSCTFYTDIKYRAPVDVIVYNPPIDLELRPGTHKLHSWYAMLRALDDDNNFRTFGCEDYWLEARL